MADKESRLAQILRKEIESDKGISEAIVNAFAANLKEKKDLRKIFPKYGVFGQVMRGVFGNEYRYGKESNRGRGSVRNEGTSGSGLSSITSGAIRITARNSMVLPAMARDMNIMKQNMQSLVRASGKKSYSKPEANYLKIGGAKKTAPKATPKAATTPGGTTDVAGGVISGVFSAFSFVSSLASSIVKGLVGILGTGLSIGGSIIGGAASLIGSLFSGVMGIGGGILSGVLGGLASIVSGMGIFGIIALAGAGYLAYTISKSVSGNINFDEYAKQIREFFKFKEGETFVDAIYKVLGKVDEKTGMNTTGIMEKVEVQFSRFLAYSGDVLTRIVDVIQLTSKMALLQMQKAFLDYGTIIIDYMGQIGGALTGMKIAPTVAAALGGAAAGAARGAAGGIPGAIIGGLIGLLAGGATIYGGAKGGKYLSEQINKTLALGTISDPEQRKLLEEMSTGKGNSETFLKIVDEIQETQEKMSKLGNSDMDNVMRKKYESKLSKLRENSVYKDFTSRYEKLFGKQFNDTTSIVAQASQAKADEIALIENQLFDKTRVENVTGSANAAADAAEQRTIKEQQSRRSTNLGPAGKKVNGVNLDSGKSIKVRDVISYFMSKGLSFEAASGIAANLWEESKLDAGAINPSSGAFGLAQWLGNRKTDFSMWATDKGYAINDPYAQLDYIWKELNSTEKKTLSKLTQENMTAEKAASIFMDTFERPSESEKNARRSRQSQIASSFAPSIEGPNMGIDNFLNEYAEKQKKDDRQFSDYFQEAMDRAFGLSAAAASGADLRGKNTNELLAMAVTELREIKSRSTSSSASPVDDSFMKVYERITGIA